MKNTAYPWQFSSAVIAETRPAKTKAKTPAPAQRRPVARAAPTIRQRTIIAMQPREKLLAAIVGVLAVLAGVWFVGRNVQASFTQRNDRIAALEKEIGRQGRSHGGRRTRVDCD